MSCVLVHGEKNRNRAVHGDVVVVELLPKSEWRGKVTALTEGQGEEKSGGDEQSKLLPTGGTSIEEMMLLMLSVCCYISWRPQTQGQVPLILNIIILIVIHFFFSSEFLCV